MKKKLLTILLAGILLISALSLVACDKESSSDYYQFGSYPQTDVTEEMGATLSTYQGTLPTSENDNGWTDYEYYISSNKTAFMWYKDITHNNAKYRAVYFTEFRPYSTDRNTSSDNSTQDNNGYDKATVYWFKYEPIQWSVLQKADGYATLLSEMVIDSQEYNYTTNSQKVGEETIYSNNYEYSTIRKWLNENFYNTAFSAEEQSKIQITTVENGGASVGASSEYACNNTEDKIYLLSYKDVTNEDYGFNSDYNVYDKARHKKTTDYAKVQGVNTWLVDEIFLDNGDWWLRSPSDSNACTAQCVNQGGTIATGYNVNFSRYGVVPVLRIQL